MKKNIGIYITLALSLIFIITAFLTAPAWADNPEFIRLEHELRASVYKDLDSFRAAHKALLQAFPGMEMDLYRGKVAVWVPDKDWYVEPAYRLLNSSEVQSSLEARQTPGYLEVYLGKACWPRGLYNRYGALVAVVDETEDLEGRLLEAVRNFRDLPEMPDPATILCVVDRAPNVEGFELDIVEPQGRGYSGKVTLTKEEEGAEVTQTLLFSSIDDLRNFNEISEAFGSRARVYWADYSVTFYKAAD